MARRVKGTARAARALVAPPPDRTVSGHVEAAGGVRQLALLRAGLDPASPRLPAAGTAEHRAYRSARRSIERGVVYEKGGPGQARRPSTAQLEAEQGRVRAVATRERLRRIRRRGLRARMTAKIRVSDDVRWRQIPAGGPGVLLSRSATDRIVGEAAAGDLADAGADLPAAVVDAWGAGAGAQFEILEVGRVSVWADGDPEPE